MSLKTSVIIPTFRRPQRLWQALTSVAHQTIANVEAVVINNGGVDVEHVILQYQERFHRPIQYIQLSEPQPIGAARNVGIDLAKGAYIAFLDDDDRWRPEHLENLIPMLDANPAVVAAYDAVLIQIESTSDQAPVPHITATCRFGIPYDPITFASDDYIVTSSILTRKSALAAIGAFDASLPFCEDWDLLLRLREHGAFHYVDAIGVEYSMRIAAQDNSGSVFDEIRRSTLNVLSQRYHLPPLVPKTFFDVAHDFHCEIIPVIQN